MGFDTNFHDLPVDETLYPLDAIYQACYQLTDRYYLWLHRENQELRIRIWPKDGVETFTTVPGELANALLDETLRLRVAERTAEVRTILLGAALREAVGVDG